jgi:glycosyltransferase involved in cell wall biosynthesis
MHIAIGYKWSVSTAGYHLERALSSLGHVVTYIGLPAAGRPGYDSTVPVTDIISALPQLPDIYLWVDPAGRYFPPGIEDLSIPTACYLIDVHLGTWRRQVARFFDGVFIAQKDHLNAFQQAVGHDQVYWMPLAAAPDVHRRHDLPKIFDVGFVGNISRAHQKTARSRRLKLIAERFRGNDYHRSYTPEELGRVYSQSRIVFNTSIADDVTMRVFEGTACHAMVVTDSTANGLEELFEVGREIITYKDDNDLLERIAYYLSNEEERARIAQAGWLRTMSEHTYGHRAIKILDTVCGAQFERRAPMRTASARLREISSRDVYIHLHMLDAVFDAQRAACASPLTRLWRGLPCIIRRSLI